MKKRPFLPVIGIILFIWIILNVNIPRVLKIISGADPYLIFIAAFLILPIILTKALKWKILIKSYKIDFPLLNSGEAWLIGFFLGIVTPGRVGEISRAYYLKMKSGVSFGRSVTTVFVDRIVDITTLFLLAILGLGIFITQFSGMVGLVFYIPIFFTTFLLLIFIITKKEFVHRFLKPLSEKFMPKKYHKILSGTFHEFYHGMGEMSKDKISYSLIICLATWLLSILQYYFLSKSLGIHLPFSFFFAVVPIVVLLDTLPISFSGIGTRDAALIFFFSLINLSSETAVSLSLLVFVVAYLLMGFGGAILWVRKPIKLNR